MRRRVGSIVVVVIVLVVGGLGFPPLSRSGEPAAIPAVTLKDLDGGIFKLDYDGARLTLVNFWATWCLPCKEEMPQIARLVDTYGAKGFRAIGIAMESGGPEDVKRFIETNPSLAVNYGIYVGDAETAMRFGDIEAVPTTLLIDEHGTVVSRFIGVTPDFLSEVGSEISRALSRPATSASSGTP